VRHERRTQPVAALRAGYRGVTVDFTFRPYEKREGEDKEAMDGLRADIKTNGIRNPLVTKDGHVLIGMRRWEIARDLGIEEVERLEITEDIDNWMAPDIDRLRAWLADVTDTTVPAYKVK